MAADFEERLAGAKAGDESCFVELFRDIQPALLRYLTTIGGRLADAYFGIGELSKCEKVVDVLLARNEGNHEALLLKAKIAYMRSEKDAARGYLEKLEAAEA